MNKYKSYPQYKNSGIEWLGEIPEYWKTSRLKFLCNITTGGKDTENKIDDGKYPFYVRSQTIEKINSYSYNGEAILTAGDGVGVGKVFHYATGKFDFHQRVYMFYSFKKVAGKFLFEYIKNNFYKVALAGVAKSTVDSLRLPLIQNFMITVPPLEEQQSISNYLDKATAKIDTLIEKQTKLIELLKEKRQAVISTAVTRGLDSSVPMKDSGVEWLGEIPEGWKVKKTKNIFSLIVEPAHANNTYELLSIYTDIGVKPRKDLEQKGNKATTTDGYWKVQKKDIIVNKLLAWMGAIGVSDYDGVTSPAYDILRPKQDVSSDFYHLLFRTKKAQTEFKKWSRGIMEMRLRLYFSEFGQIKMPVPPYDEQLEIINTVKDRTSKIDNLTVKATKAIDLLKEKRTALISSAVTGKIDVRGIV